MTETAAQVAVHQDRPAAPLRTETFRRDRPDIVGPDVPEPPFPIKLAGVVQHGFGRGGKDLGCPTANLPDDSITPMSSVTRTGVYFGYAQISPEKDGKRILRDEDCTVMPMAMSLGWNPFYKNERLTAEIHLIHDFGSDFYGHQMNAIVLGYIRPELDYTTREALIDDIETDKRVAIKSLSRPAYQKYMHDTFFATEYSRL
ncbi:riboflavin kinase [Wolfiporia cocos MD-104 SS10]|uniref:Riboflavin kinase n=1 Tax=Wolfiporia cocos (strain MD-104) TaxID=742152 RepID=A0A2H3JGP4_WOLCO|nr:riboflavin kinase [Wolfiporia cocos MD-104 SS10]